MPPRYAYWTILIDNQPTAFRSGAKEDLLPTFNRLKEKNPSAVMMWFQNGKLWPSRLDAQEAMLARGEMGRRGDARQRGGFRERHNVGARDRGDRRERPERNERPEWSPKPEVPSPKSPEKLEWKPKGEFTPAPKRSERSERPEWKARDKRSFDPDRKPAWKPKGSFDRDRKPDWKARPEKRDWKKAPGPKSRLEWTPKSQAPSPKSPEKRKWIPKEEYKKSQGIEAKRDAKWRPGGEHRDPRQKYKDAKKAKWTKFKKTIRTRWEAKSKKKS